MKKWKWVLSLPSDTAYLREQIIAARNAAERLGAEVQVLNAEMDSVTQSQQLLSLIQSPTASRPDAILVEPVSAAGLPRVAEAAVAGGIAWVVSNAQVDYIGTLRKNAKVPVFLISLDHVEVGRIQGRQIGALLPEGGSVLYLRGPAMNSIACKRFEGLEAAKPKNVELKSLKVQGATSEDAYNAVCSWLNLSTVHPEATQMIVSQNVDFIFGARKAFEANVAEPIRSKWFALPCVGAGVPSQTRSLVDQGALCAAVLTSLTLGTAVEMLVQAMKNKSQPQEHTYVEAHSYPSLEELASRRTKKESGHLVTT